MLSKLRYYSRPVAPTNTADLPEVQSAVVAYLQGRFFDASLEPIAGGTLGICFRVNTASGSLFIKTHQSDDVSKENLLKEFELLKAIYGLRIHPERFDIDLASGNRACILIDWLTASTATITPPDLRNIVAEFHKALRDWPTDRATRFATMTHLIGDSLLALLELQKLHFISTDTVSAIQDYLTRLSSTIDSIPPAICHGDLSNKNIMLSGSTNVVIDWEDAFVGFEGYDYLYWLTFMDNRKHLVRSSLGHTALDEKSERAVLLMIITIKSLISVRSKNIRPTHVPIEQRLTEVLAF